MEKKIQKKGEELWNERSLEAKVYGVLGIWIYKYFKENPTYLSKYTNNYFSKISFN